MPATRVRALGSDRPQPISSAEIAGELDALAAAVGAEFPSPSDGAPHPISPSDLLRCLRRLTSAN